MKRDIKRGRPRGKTAGPLLPDKVAEIGRLRAEPHCLTFKEIADRVGGTRMNCCALYNRWSWWLRERNRTIAA